MSFNLTAHTRSGKGIELVQINTEDTFWCLGKDEANPPSWKTTRDRYIQKATERTLCVGGPSKAMQDHFRALKHHPFIDFSFI